MALLLSASLSISRVIVKVKHGTFVCGVCGCLVTLLPTAAARLAHRAVENKKLLNVTSN